MATTQIDTHSIEDDDPRDLKATDEKAKSRRPPNSAFRQQRLKAWQPILTPKTVLPLLFGLGVIFAPIGGLLLYASAKVQEISIDYTSCHTQAPTGDPTPMDAWRVVTEFDTDKPTHPALWRRDTISKRYSKDPTTEPLDVSRCIINFYIPADMQPPIYLYYRLTKFYQNHRRYVKSLNQKQLQGEANLDIGSLSDCSPLDYVTTDTNVQKPIYPCGLIANSMFNDTFVDNSITQLNVQGSGDQNKTIPLSNAGISWSSDGALYGKSKYTNDQVVPPPNWRLRFPNNYTTQDPIPDLHTWEEFQVWMRTAGLPTFSKLALRTDNQTLLGETTYQIVIEDVFHVDQYGGTKSVLLSTRTVMGGKNPFLGVAYIVVAGLCIVMGVGFLIVQLIKPRKLGDHTYLSWNNESPSNAGRGR